MSDQVAPPQRKLPFKRTVKRKSSEGPTTSQTPTNDDGLSLFSRREEFFPSVVEDQKRRAAENEARLRKAQEAERVKEAQRSEQKKRRISPLVDDEDAIETSGWMSEKKEDGQVNKKKPIEVGGDDDDDDDNDLEYRPQSRKLSSTPKKSQNQIAHANRDSTTPRRSARNADPTTIQLDDSSDDDLEEIKPLPSSSSRTSRFRNSAPLNQADPFNETESNDGLESPSGQTQAQDTDDIASSYIRKAQERAEQRKRERLAAESGGPLSTDSPVQIWIAPRIEGIFPMMFKRKLSQPMDLVYSAWVSSQRKKEAPFSATELEAMFFTWRGHKVYAHTTLDSLGIKAHDSKGRLLPSWERGSQDGYEGHDKVLFEVWTQELFDAEQHDRERALRRARGELSDEDEAEEEEKPDGTPTPEDGGKFRIKLVSRNREPVSLTVKKTHSVHLVTRVYRTMSKGIDPQAVIELHWDGEPLDPDTSLEDADIGDMDSIEVHFK